VRTKARAIVNISRTDVCYASITGAASIPGQNLSFQGQARSLSGGLVR
jgi:hypothetical protein